MPTLCLVLIVPCGMETSSEEDKRKQNEGINCTLWNGNVKERQSRTVRLGY